MELALFKADGKLGLYDISMDLSSSSTLTAANLIKDVKVRPSVRVSTGQDVVALGAGYLEPYSESVARSKHLVVVKGDLSVACYDSEFRLTWGTTLDHLGMKHLASLLSTTVREGFEVDEVGVVMSPQASLKGDLGLVVIGASLKPKGVQKVNVETGAGKYGSEDLDEEGIDQYERAGAEATHFSLFGLDGATGELRWVHEIDQQQQPVVSKSDLAAGSDTGTDTGTDTGNDTGGAEGEGKWDQMSEAVLTQEGKGNEKLHKQYKLEDHELNREIGEVFGLWKAFKGSLLEALPHTWRSPQDTQLRLAHFEREGKYKRKKEEDPSQTKGKVGGKSKRWHVASAVPAFAVKPHDEAEHISQPNVVVVHTKAGIEAVNLFSGAHVCSLPLPSSQHRTIVYADLDNNGVIDSIEAAGCWIGATSGVPAGEELFNSTTCSSMEKSSQRQSMHTLTARSAREGNAKRRDRDLGVTAPLLVGDRLFTAVSNGAVAAVGADGRAKWKSKGGPKWSKGCVGFIVQLDEGIAVVGERSLMVYNRNGYLLGESAMIQAPVSKPYIAEDGTLVVDGKNLLVGYSIAARPGVLSRVFFSFVLVLCAAMATLAYGCIGATASGSKKGRGHAMPRKRATD
ncbi:unnamed protein product [Chrysoparadoxa australica]